jgi:hypothetical protein
MHRYAHQLASVILRGKKASIRHAPLPGGSPPWPEIEKMTREEIEDGASRNQPGFRMIRKLLSDRRFEQMMTQQANLMSFLSDLREAKIHYDLGQQRDDAILVQVAVPGERWEVEFLEDGSVEVEVFRTDGQIRDSSALDELLDRFRD